MKCDLPYQSLESIFQNDESRIPLDAAWSSRTLGKFESCDEYDSHSIPYMSEYCDLMNVIPSRASLQFATFNRLA